MTDKNMLFIIALLKNNIGKFCKTQQNKSINQNKYPLYESWAPFRILNVGNGNPFSLLNFINSLESEIGISAEKIFIEMKKEDVKETAADITKIFNLTGYMPKTLLVDGIKEFINWYKNFYLQ